MRCCRRKAVGVRNRPVRKHTAAATAGDSKSLCVDVAALENLVDSNHQVAVIVARVVILNDVAEILAIAG